MKKNSLLRKISLLTLLSVVSNFGASYSFATAAVVDTSMSTSIESQEALKIYNDLIKDKTADSNNASKINKPNSIKPSSYASTKDTYTGDFSILNKITGEAKGKEVLYSEDNNSTQDIITYDKNSDIYTLLEINNETNELIYIVNGEEFKIIQEGENINMYSKSGQVIPLVITEYADNSAAIPTNSINTISQPTMRSPISSIETKSWGSAWGPYYKTNKVAIELIGEISGITTVATIKCNHPVLGTISLVTSVISYVGNKMYATLYIKYYQYHDSSNFTYIKEVDNYYQYNDYTGFVKSNTWYFYSSRPY